MDATGGSVHDKVVSLERDWREFTSYAEAAQKLGEIRVDVDLARARVRAVRMHGANKLSFRALSRSCRP
jgi:hypothetical protein